MRQVLLTIVALLLTFNLSLFTAFGQSPQKVSYQAVVRDASDNLVSNKQIGMQISILQSTVSGTAVYVETHTPTTNANGLVSIDIGGGTVVSGSFTTINWANDTYFIKTETDPTGGTTYSITGISQLLSVPYALHAQTAETLSGGITESDPVFGAWDKSTGISITESQISDLGTYVATESDPVFGAWDKSTGISITESQISDLGTYVATESDPVFGAWDKSTGISITESQISDLGTYVATETDPVYNASQAVNISATDITNLANLSGTNTGDQDLSNLATQYALNDSVSQVRSEIPDVSGFLTNYTETDPLFTNWSKDYNDLTNTPTIPSVPDGTAIGQMLYWNGTQWVVLAPGTAGQVLAVDASNMPVWAAAGAPALNPPTADIQAASNIDVFEATINANVNPNGLRTTVEFEMGTTTAYGDTYTANPATITGIASTPVDRYIANLQSATTYHYRIKATNAVGTTYSNDQSFTTANSVPELTTDSVTHTLGVSAKVSVSVTSNGGDAVTSRGVCWSTSPNPTIADSYAASGTGIGTFTVDITGLTEGTLYYVRSYATNSVGTAYGNELSFTTLSMPTLTTQDAYNILGISANAGGTITGGGSITAQGLCWSTSPNPSISGGNLTSSFNDLITGLTANTVYYVRAYATNSVGTGYGTQISFNSGYELGANHAGGLVFYNDGLGGGLVCADSDQGNTEWGCLGSTIGVTSTSIGTGATNNSSITAACNTFGIAAEICENLTIGTYSDWFLPSKEELKLMAVLKSNGLGGLWGMYWSSSEDSDNEAWAWDFDSAYEISFFKDSYNTVRAVRAF